MNKLTFAGCVAALCLLGGLSPLAIRAADAPAKTGAVESNAAENGELLFNGKDLTGWKGRYGDPHHIWRAVSDAKLDPANKTKLVGTGSGAAGPEGVLFRGDGDTSDILSERQFGDVAVHIEFLIPEDSNSGVYLMGRYEVQILSDYGTPDNKMGVHNCGAIYITRAPSCNALKPYGEWNTYDIVFRAPRFDANGKKIENAKYLSVIMNGKQIQKDVEVKGPTGGEIDHNEKPTGPLLLQGDHGIVAFRNIRVKPMDGGTH